MPEAITVECRIFSSNCRPDLYANSKMVTLKEANGESSSKPWPTPSPLLLSKNWPDLHQSQERPLAKVAWRCPYGFWQLTGLVFWGEIIDQLLHSRHNGSDLIEKMGHMPRTPPLVHGFAPMLGSMTYWTVTIFWQSVESSGVNFVWKVGYSAFLRDRLPSTIYSNVANEHNVI